jgi:hypothetical protein
MATGDAAGHAVLPRPERVLHHYRCPLPFPANPSFCLSYPQAMKLGRGDYLANLLLYPGRPEFTAFLPDNTQGVVVQPVGSEGVLVAGTDTVRGFSRLDQAWLAALADKLEVSLADVAVPQTGVGFGGARPAAGRRG